MKRIRPGRWSAQLLQARSGASSCAITPRRPFYVSDSAHLQSSALSTSSSSFSSATGAATAHEVIDNAEPIDVHVRTALPSPHPSRAHTSAKLAALHSRLSLSRKIPLETLARALVTPSADSNPNFNNQSLAHLGSTFINYHVLEYLVCKWPRLPMAILFEAQRSYSGPASLTQIARRWGVEAAAAPGEEVDPGLLQWSPEGTDTGTTGLTGYVRAEVQRKELYYRRGMSSRVVLDDEFGDAATESPSSKSTFEQTEEMAHAALAQAIVGSVYSHCGREAAKSFVESHILSRQLDLASLFAFQMPTRELAMLCAREGFEPPLARLESETGRRSRTPVFVVGIYSGKEKLGEGAGASLDFARRTASMNALKSWYLYSPGNKVRVPSDMTEEGAAPWKAPHIDIGEII